VWAIVADRLRERLHQPAMIAATESTLSAVAGHELDPYSAADALLAALGRSDD
jgi:hypothetical protein